MNMNFNHLSDDELLRYLDKHNTDPLMQRVVDILMHKQHGIISDLVESGMNPETWTFRPDGYNEYYPGQYVSHLENTVSSIEEDLQCVQYELEDAKDEIKKLKARTVAELISELHQEIKNSNYLIAQAEKARDAAKEQEKVALSKLKMWTILSTDTTQ